MPGAVLGAGNILMNKTKISALAGKTDNDNVNLMNKGEEKKTVRR